MVGNFKALFGLQIANYEKTILLFLLLLSGYQRQNFLCTHKTITVRFQATCLPVSWLNLWLS